MKADSIGIPLGIGIFGKRILIILRKSFFLPAPPRQLWAFIITEGLFFFDILSRIISIIRFTGMVVTYVLFCICAAICSGFNSVTILPS